MPGAHNVNGAGDQVSQTIIEDPRFTGTLSHLLKNGTVISSYCGKLVVKLSSTVVVKFAHQLHFDEYDMMVHVRKHVPDLPIPRPHGVISIGMFNYIFMDFMDGTPLDEVWGSLTVSMKSSVMSQLNDLIQQLRQAPLPFASEYGSGDPPRCKDVRRHTRMSSGTVRNEADFNSFLTETTRTISPPYLQLIRSQLKTNHRNVMTHGDLRPDNILVKKGLGNTVSIIGLIDWGSSGSYPEYWEYVKAMTGLNIKRHCDWFEHLRIDSIGEYSSEFIVDAMIDTIIL